MGLRLPAVAVEAKGYEALRAGHNLGTNRELLRVAFDAYAHEATDIEGAGCRADSPGEGYLTDTNLMVAAAIADPRTFDVGVEKIVLYAIIAGGCWTVSRTCTLCQFREFFVAGVRELWALGRGEAGRLYLACSQRNSLVVACSYFDASGRVEPGRRWGTCWL